MPLVGVPSFIEFSQRSDLRCFFVIIRRPDDATIMSPDDAQAETFDLAPSIVEQPTDAFRDAAVGQPWGSLLCASSPALRSQEVNLKDPLPSSLGLQAFEMPGAPSSLPPEGSDSRESKQPEGKLLSQESAERAALAPLTPTKLEVQRADSVPVAYNSEVNHVPMPHPPSFPCLFRLVPWGTCQPLVDGGTTRMASMPCIGRPNNGGCPVIAWSCSCANGLQTLH